MGMSRALGGLLCVVCAVVAVVWILYFIASRIGPFSIGPWEFGGAVPLWIALPVVIGVVVLAVLGFWLGWIMASTKEISPPTPTPVRKKTKRK